MVRHDFHWLKEGKQEAPKVKGLTLRLSELSVKGEAEGEECELADGEIAA